MISVIIPDSAARATLFWLVGDIIGSSVSIQMAQVTGEDFKQTDCQARYFGQHLHLTRFCQILSSEYSPRLLCKMKLLI